jgi:hypothetical protein
MPDEASVRKVLERHLQSILDGDVATYHATTVPELTLYEWYVTPHRIDGLAFHDFLLAEASRPDTPTVAPRVPEGTAPDPDGRVEASSETVQGKAEKARERFDLANYHEQVYGDCAVCCYTLLLTRATSAGTSVRSHHETRVLARFGGAWKIVHVHKSPAWTAPYQPPA